MSDKLEKVCSLLDKLTLEVIMLTEQHIQAKINLEKNMMEGEVQLAKSRYIMGLKNVSALQLPTEDSQEVDAIARIHSTEDEKLYGQKSFDLEIQKKPKPEETDINYQDPLRWFGVLVPQDLHKAQTNYRQALIRCVQCANIQTQLHETCVKIKQLKKYKAQLIKNEE